ncbi:uncharacterized protein LOC133735129 [Rosa rugosa]|uniref:uncharacterized protein LOC133735129 n=1 Tax=Rosa rugosa TaxID=74645 RepID=UPI002B40AC24|nr:uncharacterized protein LOC133735129 [Rosa rugosa]XP_062018531.1 uncharacterized protein LOC133735129 [Rosa rugosa]XP_062018532.1 uncharacterized protein LOC133735129 [Rosa rugosa]
MRISNRGSHDMSPDIGDIIGLELKGDNALIAADIKRSSLVLCGNAFSDSNATKEALVVLSGSVIFARRGLPLSARLLVFGDYMLLLCAPEDTIKGCGDLLVPGDVGVIRSSEGVAPLFQTGSSGSSNLFKLPAAAVLATVDSDFAYNYLGRWGKLYSFLLSCKAHET